MSMLEGAADTVRWVGDSLPEHCDSPVPTETMRAHLYRYADAFDASAERARTLAQQANRPGGAEGAGAFGYPVSEAVRLALMAVTRAFIAPRWSGRPKWWAMPIGESRGRPRCSARAADPTSRGAFGAPPSTRMQEPVM
jgi:hypothetical protein